MKLSCLLVALAAISVAASVFAQSNQPLTSVVSVSRQFTAYAPGLVTAAELVTFAERVKHDWADALGLADDWRDPIIMIVHDRGSIDSTVAAVRIGLVQIGPILRYEIDCRTPPPLDEQTLRPAVVEALSLEVANRSHPQGSLKSWSSTSVPTWLIEGLSGVVEGRPDRLVAIARRSSQSSRPTDVATLMDATRLPEDDADRELFAANAWLLTDGLLRLPGGQGKLQRFLAGLHNAKNAKEVFDDIYQANFPNAVALEKWWSLCQARLNLVVVPQDLTVAETGKLLDELLTYQQGLKFDQLIRYADQDWLRKLLPNRLIMIQGLLSRANPLYRPVLDAYLDATQLLIDQKLNRYVRKTRQAEALRTAVDQRMQEINRVLDHQEMAGAGDSSSNAFQQYFQTFKNEEEFERQRRNPISDYLDKFDQ